LVHCDDVAVHRALARYFHHCIGETAPIVTTCHIARTQEGALSLVYDDEPPMAVPGLGVAYVFTRLARDIATRLVMHDKGHMVFHAAGVAHHRKGVILCGPPGCGKSTLSAWLSASGFDFLSDEVIAVTLNGSDHGSSQIVAEAQGPREMHGLTCPIVLKRGSAFVWRHWLGEDAAQEMIYVLNDTVWVDSESLRPHSVRAVARPWLLVFPRYSAHGVFRAQRLSPAEVAFRLMHQLVNFESLPEQGFAAITCFARYIPAYSVTYTDVTEVEAWLKKRALA
jgi:hypothetical protein